MVTVGSLPNGSLLPEWRSSPAVIVSTVAFAVFTDVFLYGVVVPVLPFTLSGRMGIANEEGVAQYWVSVSFAVFSAALVISSPIWGYVGDRYRNKRALMVVGLAFLLGATLVLWLAVSIPMLLLGRVLQGASAGLTWTVGLALVVDSVEPANVGLATGWVEWSTCVGTSIGPLLGGIVFDKLGYDAVFELCLSLVALDIALRLLVLDNQPWRPSPLASVSSDQCVGPGPGANATQGAGEKGTARANRVARRWGDLLRKPRFLAALWGSAVASSLYSSFDSTLALFVSSTFYWDATNAGLMFLALTVPACLAPFIGAVGDRIGAKWLTTAGFLLATPLLVCLRFVRDDSIGDKVMLGGLLAGIGLCLTFVKAPLMAEVAWSIQAEADDQGTVPITLAYSLYNMAFSSGAVAGPVMAGAIRNGSLWGGGLGGVGSVFAILTFATAMTQAIWVGGAGN